MEVGNQFKERASTENSRSLLSIDPKVVVDHIDEDTKMLFCDRKFNGDSFVELNSERSETFLNDLVEGTVNLLNLTRQEGYDTLIFLDKSARPMAHIYSHVWNDLFPDEDKPQIRFINNYDPRNDQSGNNSSEALEEVKKIFQKDIENKKVLVVDEYVNSGRSLIESKTIIDQSFQNVPHDVTYTGVLRNRWISWRQLPATANDQPRRGIGVYDRGSEVVLHATDNSEIRIPSQEPRSFISSPLVSKVREIDVSTADVLQQQVNTLRNGLANIAKLIAEHSTINEPGTFKVKPFLPRPDINRYLNGSQFD